MTSSTGTLLVVDDDQLNRLLLATSLEEEGYVVDTAADGRRALQTVREKPFDVVLLDLLMPEMDGFEVLAHMKGDEDLRHIPVIVISALDEMESVIRCIEMGATDYLPKPFDPVLLRARVNASLTSKRMHDMENAFLKQIRKVTARLQAIFEGAAIGIALVDTAGRTVESNPALQSMLDYTTDELRGMAFADYTHPGDVATDLGLFQEMMEGKRTHYQLEKRYIRKTGQLIWGRLTVSLVRDPEGNPQFGIGMVEDVTERRRVEEKLRYLSIHDVLTGLYNRTYFEEEISKLQHSRLFPITVIMLDVNGLKVANDTFGHSDGDELLRRTADVLRSTFRPEDVIARIGGDEFAVLLPSTSREAAGTVVVRTRSNLSVHNAEYDGPPLSFSIGAATAERGESLSETIKRADAHMYEDKAQCKA